MYRILYQKWSKDKAIDEMINGGYGFHTTWYNNIIEYIQKRILTGYKNKSIQNKRVFRENIISHISYYRSRLSGFA